MNVTEIPAVRSVLTSTAPTSATVARATTSKKTDTPVKVFCLLPGWRTKQI